MQLESVLQERGVVGVTAAPDLFTFRRLYVDLPAGLSVREMVETQIADAALRRYVVVYLGGERLDPALWHAIRPKAGARLSINVVPMQGQQGDDDKAVRTFAIALITVLSAGVGGAIAGAGFAGAAVAGAFASAAISIGGNLAVNALLPPPEPKLRDFDDEGSPSLTGGRNSARPFGPVPVILGRNRVVPALGTRSFTETVGTEQFFRQLFVWGYGPTTLPEQMKIGETPLEQFDDFEIEHRQGFPDDEPLTLFTDTVFEEPLSVVLTVGDKWLVRTTEPDVDEGSIDVTLPRGLIRRDKLGKKADRTVIVEAQFAPVGTPVSFGPGDVDAGANKITIAGHPYVDGEIVDFTTDGTLPGNLASGIDHYVTAVGPQVLSDLHMNANDGTIVGASFVKGAIGTHALRFDKVGDKVDITAISAYQNLSAWTFKFRTKLNTFGDDTQFRNIMATSGVAEERIWDFTFDNLGNPAQLRYTHGRTGGAASPVVGNLSLATWHDIAVTKDDQVFTFYLDGNKTGDFTFSGDANETLSAGLKINFLSATSPDFEIEELTIYDVAQDAATILAQLNTPLVGNEANLIGYWPVTADEFQVSLTEGGPAVDITDGGAGNHKVTAHDWSAGVEGKAFAARAQTLPPPQTINIRGRERDWTVSQTRIYRVTMDRFTGKVSVAESNDAVTELLDAHGGQSVGFKPETPVPPPWRDFFLRIAEVTIVSTDTGIQSASVVDARPSDPPFLGGLADFVPSADGSFNLQIGAGTLAFAGDVITARTDSLIRRQIRFIFPTRDQHDVRVRKQGAQSNSNRESDLTLLTAFRSIINESPIRMAGLSVTALRIKATNQLQGQVDEFSGVLTSILPDWDGTAWVERPTRNCAAMARTVRQGPANAVPVPDSGLDLPGIQDWSQFCVDNDFTFDLVIDFPSTVDQTLRFITAAGRAVPATPDGVTWGVVIDEPRGAHVSLYAARNCFGFSGERDFSRLPHGLKIRFIDETKDWDENERTIFADGFDENSATLFEGIELPGVTNPDQIFRHGRYHIAQPRLRPERFFFFADIEAIVNTRGDLIAVQHDVILVGLGSGRLKTVITDGGGNATALTLDNRVTMEAGKSYAVVIRTLNDAALTAAVVTAAGETTSLTLVQAIPAAQVPAVGDLFAFGEAGEEVARVILKEIEPASGPTFRMVCVAEAPDLHLADQGPIPAFDPGITPQSLGRPMIDQVRSDEEVLIRQVDGSLAPRILVSLSQSTGPRPQVAAIEAQFRLAISTVGWTRLAQLPADAAEISFDEVEQGETYELRARFLGRDGREGSWTAPISETVIGKATLPPDVPNLFLQGPDVTWDYPDPPIDVTFGGGFQVRSHAGDNRAWNSAVPAHPDLLTGPPFSVAGIGSGTRTILVKAVDSAGNESANAAILVAGLGDPSFENIVLDMPYAPGFAGTIVNGTVTAGVLEADSDGDFWLGDDANLLWKGDDNNLVWSTQFKRMTYTADLTVTRDAKLLLEAVVAALDGWSLEIAQDLPTALWKGQDGNRVWSGVDSRLWWAATPGEFFAWPGELQVKAAGYRIRLTTFEGTNAARVTALTAKLDVPDIDEILGDVAIGDGGSRLPITKSYEAIKFVRLTLQDDGGDAVRLERVDLDAELGPLIQARDNSGALTTATIDAEVRGHA